ncbi:uncharacterized protein Tco025E_06042 [Trypanosoma conorhini]|uniref:Uncharacterized protein n=1 Tax=Trypanosoma conorhini TaxID=83891 RepID=A0A422P845_9TRYP|nr:uncharacterized protein Tco025E_06042 [Trypanosoma conorhini]RNF13885.1 hypothetical protein Tco025E_06042 [Trypanosoma conorhini]
MEAAALEARLEYERLLCEREFLLRETAATACLTARATTARQTAAETDIGLLRDYLEGRRRGDARACRTAEEGMRAKVHAARRRAEELRHILAALQKEAVGVRAGCASLPM